MVFFFSHYLVSLLGFHRLCSLFIILLVVNNAKVVLKILRGNRKHCSYLGDLMLAPSFSLPCGISNLFCLSSSSYKYQIHVRNYLP